uniref:Uncharacterized protein n=1 Tax=Anguilla anguilla TaxID=7936 RepID=A0A0E9RZF8_ANGAN
MKMMNSGRFLETHSMRSNVIIRMFCE